MSNEVKFLHGKDMNLNNVTVSDGTFYVTEENGKLFLGHNGKLLPLLQSDLNEDQTFMEWFEWPLKTTVIIYTANGEYRGTLTTTSDDPQLLATDALDTGVLFLKDSTPADDDGVYWTGDTENGICIGVFGNLPVGLSVENDHNITSEGDIDISTMSDYIHLTPGKTYTYYTYSEDDITSEVITTVNIAGHLLTTTSSNPILHFDDGSGQFFLQEYTDGNYDEQYVCNPTNTYPAEAIPLLGAPTPTIDGIALTPGQTYYYSYYYDDGSPTFAVMINYNGNITWQKAIAGCFYVTWIDSSHVQIGGSSVQYLSDTTFIGLSTEHDGNVTGTNDIPYGTDIDTGMGDGADKRSYIYYLYDEESDLDPDIIPLPTTTVNIYNADGSYKGTLITSDPSPEIKLDAVDSGELYLKGGIPADKDGNNDKSEYLTEEDGYGATGYGAGMYVAVNAAPPYGLSVTNDNNITSDGDIKWGTTDTKYVSLEVGSTYTYYVYGDHYVPDTVCDNCGESFSSSEHGFWCPNCHYEKCTNCGNWFSEDEWAAPEAGGAGNCPNCGE